MNHKQARSSVSPLSELLTDYTTSAYGRTTEAHSKRGTFEKLCKEHLASSEISMYL